MNEFILPACPDCGSTKPAGVHRHDRPNETLVVEYCQDCGEVLESWVAR